MQIDSVIFGFGCKARHGKDTAALAIKEARSNDYDIRIYGFGHELKDEINKNAMMAGGMPRLFDKGLYDPNGGYLQTNGNFLPLPEWVQYDPNPDMSDPLCPYGKQRTLLQWWGTEYRRAVDPYYWVNKVKKRISDEKPDIALIIDVRFPNEMEFVREFGETIKVFRPGFDNGMTHYSETALDYVPDSDWSAVIVNDGTLEALKLKAVGTFDMLMDKVPQ